MIKKSWECAQVGDCSLCRFRKCKCSCHDERVARGLTRFIKGPRFATKS